MLVMLTSGPRVSEVTALTWADISWPRPGAHVLWHGKGRKERISLLDAPAIAGLRHWQRENPAGPSAFVFTARGTTRKMTTDAVAQRIQVHAGRGGRSMSQHRHQERHPARPPTHFRDAAAIRGYRRAIHRADARP